MERRYSIGSLFSGIGGFELGLERSIPGAYTAWQVEQEEYCQKVLSKRWPDAKIFDDVRAINKNNVEKVDILCGGFPCQDISLAGTGGGINAERSGLWWEFHRIINELQPRAAIMENVPAITIRGLGAVSGSLSEIGYDCEWCVISASQFGAPHKRERWFCVAYPRGEQDFGGTSTDSHEDRERASNEILSGREAAPSYDIEGITDSNSLRSRQTKHGRPSSIVNNGNEVFEGRSQISIESLRKHAQTKFSESSCISRSESYWRASEIPKPTICRVDDGIPHRLDRSRIRSNKKRLRALGNAIVPQCSEWIGKKVWESGILL